MLKDIDFAALYRAHMARSGRQAKPASSWDAKAEQMSSEMSDSAYAKAFVAQVVCSEQDTVLDVGSGPGTIGLALAPKVKQVYCLDYSAGMLAAMERNAAALHITNAQPILASWEDDWAKVPRCDIAVVSRASIVADMADALNKLNAIATKRVYLTQLVGGRFSSREMAELLDRADTSFPDHMYIINLLYQRHIYPTLTYIEMPSRLAGATNEAEFIDKVANSFGPLSNEEQQKVAAWYQKWPDYAQQGGEPQRWALLSWTPA